MAKFEKLAAWAKKQRHDFLQKTILPSRRRRLDSIGFHWTGTLARAHKDLVDKGEGDRGGGLHWGVEDQIDLDDASDHGGAGTGPQMTLTNEAEASGVPGSSETVTSTTRKEVLKKDNGIGHDAAKDIGQKWSSRFEQLKTFMQEHRHDHVPRGNLSSGYEQLALWVVKQRFEYQHKTLKQERLRRLTSIGFHWTVAEAKEQKARVEKGDGKERAGHSLGGLSETQEPQKEAEQESDVEEGGAPATGKRKRSGGEIVEMEGDGARKKRGRPKKKTGEATQEQSEIPEIRQESTQLPADKLNKLERVLAGSPGWVAASYNAPSGRRNSAESGQRTNGDGKKAAGEVAGGSMKEIVGERWRERYQQLLAFQSKHGHPHVRKDEPLGAWVMKQRQAYHDGRLKRPREDLLRSADFEFDEISAVFKRRALEAGAAHGATGRSAGGASMDWSKMKCTVCRSGHDEDRIILCDTCERGFHIHCLLPPLPEVPEGDWFCPACAAIKLADRCPVCESGDHEDRMILCDACGRGFHLECLSPPLSHVPDGDWFCVQCAAVAALICPVCDSGEREDRMILCDGCGKGFHLECLTPPLTAVPEGDWFCAGCPNPVSDAEAKPGALCRDLSSSPGDSVRRLDRGRGRGRGGGQRRGEGRSSGGGGLSQIEEKVIPNSISEMGHHQQDWGREASGEHKTIQAEQLLKAVNDVDKGEVKLKKGAKLRDACKLGMALLDGLRIPMMTKPYNKQPQRDKLRMTLSAYLEGIRAGDEDDWQSARRDLLLLERNVGWKAVLPTYNRDLLLRRAQDSSNSRGTYEMMCALVQAVKFPAWNSSFLRGLGLLDEGDEAGGDEPRESDDENGGREAGSSTGKKSASGRKAAHAGEDNQDEVVQLREDAAIGQPEEPGSEKSFRSMGSTKEEEKRFLDPHVILSALREAHDESESGVWVGDGGSHGTVAAGGPRKSMALGKKGAGALVEVQEVQAALKLAIAMLEGTRSHVFSKPYHKAPLRDKVKSGFEDAFQALGSSVGVKGYGPRPDVWREMRKELLRIERCIVWKAMLPGYPREKLMPAALDDSSFHGTYLLFLELVRRLDPVSWKPQYLKSINICPEALCVGVPPKSSADNAAASGDEDKGGRGQAKEQRVDKDSKVGQARVGSKGCKRHREDEGDDSKTGDRPGIKSGEEADKNGSGKGKDTRQRRGDDGGEGAGEMSAGMGDQDAAPKKKKLGRPPKSQSKTPDIDAAVLSSEAQGRERLVGSSKEDEVKECDAETKEKWEERYRELEAYKKEHGHVCVPQAHQFANGETGWWLTVSCWRARARAPALSHTTLAHPHRCCGHSTRASSCQKNGCSS